MSFLTDDDRIPLTKQDRFQLEQIRLLEEILDAVRPKKRTPRSNKKKEVIEDVSGSNHPTRRERGVAN